MAKFGAHSMWIIKENQHWFPMKPLYAVLKVYFKINLLDLSTCGSTELSEKMCMSYFEDDFGNVGSKEVIQP
jgi:hypothetical protein